MLSTCYLIQCTSSIISNLHVIIFYMSGAEYNTGTSLPISIYLSVKLALVIFQQKDFIHTLLHSAENTPVPTLPKFNPDEDYFTMKEMGVAVLVSFIAGATMLAVVILVIWRCRNMSMWGFYPIYKLVQTLTYQTL